MTRLPAQLGQLQGLFTLNLDRDRITEPVEVLQELRNSTGGIATKLVRILKEKLLDYQPYNAAKVMVIGPRVSFATN